MNLVLGNGVSGRRLGLPKNISGSLLRSVNAPESQRQVAMPRAVQQKATIEVEAESIEKRARDEEDINRPPDSDSDNDSDEAFRRANNEDIKSTEFVTGAKKQEQKGENIAVARGGRKGAATAIKDAPTNARPRRGQGSPVSSHSASSPKRKSQQPLGAGMVDAHGRLKVKKPRTSTYGRKVYQAPPKIASDTDEESPKKTFQRGPSVEESPEKPDTKDSPPRKFKNRTIERSDSSDVEERPSYKRPNISIDDSPATTPGPKFKTYDVAESPGIDGVVHQPVFKHPNATTDELLKIAGTIVSKENIPRPPAPALLPIDDDEDDFQTMTQMAKCPMCGETVDPADLRAFGRMDTRKQEKFCRSHRKTTALKTWEVEEYPTINWAKLDSRITKHHSFIKGLINGADSYYRERLAETVNAGKDRSLRKSEYNPIPGYYGTRGLRAISENTMRKFTPLLKRRMVVDRLMAARGFTPYVEYVVVPEVAIKLIMEDMKCKEERAREIMSESLEVGELLSEELKDVVTRNGSEEMENSDD